MELENDRWANNKQNFNKKWKNSKPLLSEQKYKR